MHKKKIFFSIALVVFSLFGLWTTQKVYADSQLCDTSGDLLGLTCVEGSGLSSDDPRTIVTRIINVTLGLLGIIATVLILYAGFLWMTAGGNDEKVDKAKSILTASVIGLIIILSAYAISRYVLSSLYSATTGTPYNVSTG